MYVNLTYFFYAKKFGRCMKRACGLWQLVRQSATILFERLLSKNKQH